MSDDARRTPEVDPASPAGSTTQAAERPSPLQSGIVVAGRVPAGGEWGELSDAVFSIWTRPRETIRRIVTANPRYGVVWLAALSGSTTTLMRWPGDDGATLGTISLIVVACTLGPLVNIACLWLGAWIVRGLGRAWLGGQAGPEEMRAALAWGCVPQVMFLPLALLSTIVFSPAAGSVRTTTQLGGPVGVSGAAPSPGTIFGGIFLLVWALLSLTLAIWSLYISSNTVAEVQGYRSAWRGFGNLLLPGAILIGIVLVFAALIALI